MKRVLFVGAIAAALAAGCGEEQAPVAATSTKAESTPALPASLKLSAAPADAKDVAAAKASVKNGDRVTIRGVVAGREEPIANNRAILTLLDPAVKTCEKSPMDDCKTPWDACCEPADVLSKNSLTVQVVDREGRPVKASLATIEGVKPLAKLVVTGSANVTSDGVVLVNADGVHVEP